MKKNFLNGTAAFLIAVLALALALGCSTPNGGDGNGLSKAEQAAEDAKGSTKRYAGLEGNPANTIWELTVTGGSTYTLTAYVDNGGNYTGKTAITGKVKSASGNTLYLTAPWYDPDDGTTEVTVPFKAVVGTDGVLKSLNSQPNEYLNSQYIPSALTDYTRTSQPDFGAYAEPNALTPAVVYLKIHNMYNDFKVIGIALSGTNSAGLEFFDEADKNLVVNYQRTTKVIPLIPDFEGLSTTVPYSATVDITTNDPELGGTAVSTDNDAIDFYWNRYTTVKLTREGGSFNPKAELEQ